MTIRPSEERSAFIYNQTDELPDELSLQIFRYVPPNDLVNACPLVSRKWREVTSDEELWKRFHPQELFPVAKFFGNATWENLLSQTTAMLDEGEKLVLEKGRPYLDKRTFLKLQCLSSKTENNDGISFVTVPGNLKLSTLVKLFFYLPNGNKCWFGPIPTAIHNKIDAISSPTPYTVAMTNSPILGSCEALTLTEKKKVIDKTGGEMIQVFPALIFAALTYINSSEKPRERLYSNFTLCSDEISDFSPDETPLLCQLSKKPWLVSIRFNHTMHIELNCCGDFPKQPCSAMLPLNKTTNS